MKTSWSCPSRCISAGRSTAASEAATSLARSNSVVARPLPFQTAAPVAMPWSNWPVGAIASWSWARATIRCRSSRTSSFGGSRRQAMVTKDRGAHSHRSAFDAAVEFVAAKGAALVPFADRIGWERGIGLERFVAVVLGAALRPIAEAKGLRIVPEGARIVRRAVEDLADDIGMLEPDADQLQEIFRLEPDRQSPLVSGPIGDVADADRGRAQAMLVGIERRERLAEGLAD